MLKLIRIQLACLLLLTLALPALLTPNLASAAPIPFASEQFDSVWHRTDQLVSEGATARTYLWGPEPFTMGVQESYVESPTGKRLVQYFDKSRMEITYPNGDKNSQYYVTNGLIARELMSGQMQVGDNQFEPRNAAEIGVAGDSDDVLGPTYKTMNTLMTATTEDVGNPVTKAINRAGDKRDGTGEFGKYNVKQDYFEKTTGHNIAEPFWTFLNQTGPVLTPRITIETGRLFDPVFYATGLPTTEAWWSQVKVAGVVKDVLVQAFERRILTYTPANPTAFQVEMGNIGRHYYQWRYGEAKPQPFGSLYFSGKGTKTTNSFRLPQGVARFKITYQGKAEFTVALQDAQKANLGILANEYDEFKSELLQDIETTGDYTLDIKAIGNWSVEVQGMDILQAESSLTIQKPFMGSGSATLKVYIPKNATTTFKMSHYGESNFSVVGYDVEGVYNALWINDIGGTIGLKETKNLEQGDYYLSIEADGKWEIEISQ